VKWELVHHRNAWQSLMAWAGSMVQPGVRIKHLKEKVEEPGRGGKPKAIAFESQKTIPQTMGDI